LEGIFIIGSFSYLGAYIAQTYHYNYLVIGLIMTGFGLASVVGGRLSGKLVMSLGPRALLTLGLLLAMTADLILPCCGQWLGSLIGAVALLGLGFIFTHSTLLTRATEFAQQARGAAMSLVAFCFMGGGGLGTALGGAVIARWGMGNLFAVYGLALLMTCLLSFALIGRTSVEQARLATQKAQQ
jgi:predicted MFS family arabinose efflux permease